MDSDPLAAPQTPPLKRRKLTVVQPSPPKLSDLLAAFGARRLPESVSRMAKEADGRDLRPSKQGFSYAESDESISPTPSPGNSSFGGSTESSKTSVVDLVGSDSEDELQASGEVDDDDVIHVGRKPKPTRQLPQRSTRKYYSSPKRVIKKKNVTYGRRATSSKLTSNLLSSKSKKPLLDTERNRARNDIAEHTKPKRDAFVLAIRTTSSRYCRRLAMWTSYSVSKI